MESINNKNYKDLALANYLNRQCIDIDEFNKDLIIIHQLNKQFNLYINRAQYINLRLISNIIVTTFNNFKTPFCIELLFFMISIAFHKYLYTVLYYMGCDEYKPHIDLEFLYMLEREHA